MGYAMKDGFKASPRDNRKSSELAGRDRLAGQPPGTAPGQAADDAYGSVEQIKLRRGDPIPERLEAEIATLVRADLASRQLARVVADGSGLTPTITFIVASDLAIATKRVALQDPCDDSTRHGYGHSTISPNTPKASPNWPNCREMCCSGRSAHEPDSNRRNRH
jgi:hypothetical protein